MKNISYLTQLSCSSCLKSFSNDQIQTYCINCNAPLLAVYDLLSVKNHLDRDSLKTRTKGMWRWSELLPVRDQDNIVSLGEGDTPLIRLSKISQELGLSNVFIKEEALNPTGSFKARGMSAAVSKTKEFGVINIVIPSAGNAGGALAAYASRAGVEALIYMPKSTPASNIAESKIMGARVELVDGLIDQAGKYAEQKSTQEGWFNMSTFKEPYRVEGKKIMGYEIAESLGWKLPDIIIYPTGGGTGLVGMWKAFEELKELGWLESNTMPRMVAVQSDGCAPIVQAFHAGETRCEYWQDAHTIATGLCVPKSIADQMILNILRESKGTAVSVSDENILDAQKRLAQKEGIFSCPEGAATLAALEKLVRQRVIDTEETVILFNTGSGLKYINKPGI
ncbi:MAG: threonine synthase [Anaerolineales bacterium]